MVFDGNGVYANIRPMATEVPEQAAAALIRQATREAGISQAELARRTGIHSSVLSAYEHGRRQPSVAALARIARACGQELRVDFPSAERSTVRAGRILAQVLDLAEQLPYRPSRELAYPPLYREAA
jgi:transcriptional regulator with XRE-family HTH domain